MKQLLILLCLLSTLSISAQRFNADWAIDTTINDTDTTYSLTFTETEGSKTTIDGPYSDQSKADVEALAFASWMQLEATNRRLADKMLQNQRRINQRKQVITATSGEGAVVYMRDKLMPRFAGLYRLRYDTEAMWVDIDANGVGVQQDRTVTAGEVTYSNTAGGDRFRFLLSDQAEAIIRNWREYADFVISKDDNSERWVGRTADGKIFVLNKAQ